MKRNKFKVGEEVISILDFKENNPVKIEGYYYSHPFSPNSMIYTIRYPGGERVTEIEEEHLRKLENPDTIFKQILCSNIQLGQK